MHFYFYRNDHKTTTSDSDSNHFSRAQIDCIIRKMFTAFIYLFRFLVRFSISLTHCCAETFTLSCEKRWDSRAVHKSMILCQQRIYAVPIELDWNQIFSHNSQVAVPCPCHERRSRFFDGELRKTIENYIDHFCIIFEHLHIEDIMLTFSFFFFLSVLNRILLNNGTKIERKPGQFLHTHSFAFRNT